jgi:AcrR family transcriptional regulator
MASSHWTKENFERLFREFSGEDDGSPQAKKRARILAAATELFLRQGYRKTSVEDVARRAEIAKGTVYLYFENKATLLVHVLAIEKRVMLKRLEPLLAGRIPEPRRLRFYLGVVLTIVRDMPLTARLINRDGELMAAIDEIDPALFAENRQRGQSMMLELLELAAPGVFSEDEKRLRADALMGLGFFGAMLANDHLRGGRSVDELATALADIITFGVIHRPPKEEP